MSSSPSSPVENNISSAQAAEPVPEAQAAALSAHPSTINPAVPSAFPLRQNSLENVSDVPDAQHEGHQDVEVDVEAMDVVHHAHAPSIDTTACSTSSPQTAWYPDPPSCTNSARTRASRVPASPSFDEAEARSCAVSRVGGRVCAEEGESRATSRLNKFLNPAMNNKVEHEREHDVEIMPVGVGVTSVTASRTTLVDPPATTTTGSGRSLSSSCAPASPLSTIATAVNSYNQAAGGTGTLTLVPVLPQTSCYSKSATVGGDHGDDVDQQQQGSNQNGPAASSSTSTSSSTALLQPLPRQTRSAPSELAGLAATASAKNTGAAGGGAGITVAKVTTDGSSSSTVVNSIKTSLLSTPGRFVVPEDGSSTSMRGGTSTRPADVDVLKLGMVPFTSGAPATSTVLERTSCAGGPDEKEEGGKKQLLQGNDYIEKINLSPRFGTTSDHAGFLTSGADDHYARHRPGVSSLLSATSSKASASAPVAQQVLDRTTPRKERSEDLTSSSSGTSSDVELVQVRNRNASGSSAEVQHVDQEAVDTDLQPMTSSSSCTTSGAPEGAPRERPAEDAVADPSLIFDGSNNTSLFGSSDTTYVLNTTRSTSSTISSLASSRTTGCKQAALGGSSSCNSGSNLNLLLKGNDSCSTIDTTASSYSNCSSSGGSSSTTRIVGASGAAHEPSTQHDELSGSSSSTGNASSWSSKPGVDTVFDVTNPAAAAPVEEVLDPSKNDTASNHPPILVSRRSVSTPDCHSTSSRASSSLQELQSGGATSSTDNCSPQSRSYQGQQPAKMLTPSEGSSSGLLPDQHGSLVRSKSSSDILSPTGGGTTTCSSRHPPDADPWKGWRVLIDTYYLYYYNTYTNTSQWQLPKELHPVLGEWKQITTNSGNQFWWNNKAQLSLWEDPRQTYDVFSAVLSGNLLFLYLFVECGGKLEITHPDTNATLLHYAVASGNRRMVDYLMDKFFNIPTRTSSCSAEGQDKGASRGAGAGVDQVKGESTTSTTTKTSSSTCAADSVEGSFHWIDKEGNDPLVYTVRTGYWNLIKPLMSRFPVRITRSGGQQEDLRKKEDFLPTIPWNVEQALHLAYAMGAWECVRELQPYAGAGLRLKHAANGGHMDDDNTSAPARLDHGSSVGRTANENFNRFKTGKKSAEESSTSRTYSSGHIEVVTRGQHSSTTTSRSTPTHSSSRSPYDSWSADERSSEISDHRSAAGGVGSSSSAAVFFSPILQHQPVVAPVLMPLLDPNQKITRIVSNLVEGVLGPWEADSDDDEQFLDAEDHINQYEQLENFDQLAAEDDHVESLQDFSHEATAHELLAEHESLLSYSNAVAGAPASADGRGSEQLHQERYKKDLPDDVDAFAGAGQPAHNEAGDRKKFVLQKQQDQECGYANAEKDPEADPVEHVSSVFATEDQDQNLNFIPAASDSNYFSTFTRAEDSSLSFPSGHPSTASTSQKIVSEAEEQSDHTSTTDTTTTPNSADGSARARTSEGARDLTFPFIEQAPDCDESTSSIVPVEDQDRTRGQRTTQHQPFPEIKISETTALGAEAIREGTATTSDELDEESGSLAPLWTDRSEDFANYSATESCNPQEAGESELVLTGHKSPQEAGESELVLTEEAGESELVLTDEEIVLKQDEELKTDSLYQGDKIKKSRTSTDSRSEAAKEHLVSQDKSSRHNKAGLSTSNRLVVAGGSKAALSTSTKHHGGDHATTRRSPPSTRMMFQEDNFYDEDDDFRTPMDDEDDTGSSTQVDERPSSRGPSATASPSTMTGALEGNNSTTTKVRQQHSSSYSDPTESSTSSDSPGSPDTLEHRRGMKRHSSSELDTIPIPNLELFSSSTRYRGVRPPEARPIPRIAGGSGLGGSSGGSYSGSSAGCSFTAKHYNHNRSSGGASTSSSSSIQGRNRWNSSYGTSRDTIEEVDGLENSVVPGSYNSTLTLATGSSSRDKNSVHKNYYVEGDPRLYHQNSLLTGEDPDFDEEMRQNFYFSVMKTFFRLAKNPSALIRSLQNLIIAAFPVLLTQDSSSSGSEEETVIENLAEQQINASNSSSSVGMNSLRRLFLYSSNNRAPSGSLYSATSAGGEQHQPGSSRTATINGKSMISLSRNYLYQKNKSSRSSNMLLLGTHLSTVEEGDVY